MRPKTNLQKEVYNLHCELPPITAKQADYGRDKCFKPKGFATSKNIWCAECGQAFKREDSQLSISLFGVDCPHCGKHLEVSVSNCRTYKPQRQYYTVITTFKGYQLLRHFIVDKECRKGYPSCVDVIEVVQLWINSKGKTTIIARPTNTMMGCAYDVWCLGSMMEIKTDAQIRDKYHIFSYVIKREELLPELRYAKIQNDYFGIVPDLLFSMILKCPFVETLIKQEQFELLHYMQDNIDKVSKLWPSIRIALRHGLTLRSKKVRDYIDYLHMSKDLGRDIHSPKYLVPDDIDKAHLEVVRLKTKHDERKRLEDRIKEAKAYEAQYLKDKAKYLDIVMQEGDINIHVLQSVQEFAEEGTLMHHCVYACSYFKKKDSLILSATIKGKRIETIEISLRTFEIIQSRGLQNRNTPYHDQILKLVNKNINLIKQVA